MIFQCSIWSIFTRSLTEVAVALSRGRTSARLSQPVPTRCAAREAQQPPALPVVVEAGDDPKSHRRLAHYFAGELLSPVTVEPGVGAQLVQAAGPTIPAMNGLYASTRPRPR